MRSSVALSLRCTEPVEVSKCRTREAVEGWFLSSVEGWFLSSVEGWFLSAKQRCIELVEMSKDGS